MAGADLGGGREQRGGLGADDREVALLGGRRFLAAAS